MEEVKIVCPECHERMVFMKCFNLETGKSDQYFECPYCWLEINTEDTICPVCGTPYHYSDQSFVICLTCKTFWKRR